MYYRVYIDAVFVTNLVMDFVLLRLLIRVLRLRCSIWRSWLGALAGALGACLILVIPTDSPAAVIFLIHGLTAVVMVKAGCGVKSRSMLVQAVVTLYFTAFLCGGVWDVMFTGGEMPLLRFFLYAGITWGILTFASILRDYWKMRKGNLYNVRLNYQGKVLCVKGLYDTGNRLTDLGSDRPVSIATFQLLEDLLPAEQLQELQRYQKDSGIQGKGEWRNLRPHFLTFQSAGNPEGMALAVTVDDMCICREHELLHISQPVLAVPLNEFVLPKDYQIILNGKLLE